MTNFLKEKNTSNELTKKRNRQKVYSYLLTGKTLTDLAILTNSETSKVSLVI